MRTLFAAPALTAQAVAFPPSYYFGTKRITRSSSGTGLGADWQANSTPQLAVGPVAQQVAWADFGPVCAGASQTARKSVEDG